MSGFSRVLPLRKSWVGWWMSWLDLCVFGWHLRKPLPLSRSEQEAVGEHRVRRRMFLFIFYFCCEWPSRGAIGRGMTLMSFCGDDHVGVLWCLIILEWLLHKGCLSTTGVTWQMSLLWHWSRMNILLWRMKTKWVVRRTTYDANVLRGALHFEQTKSMEWHWFEGSVKMARCPFYDWPWHPESWSVHVTCCKYVCVPRDKYVCTASCVSSVQHDTCSKDVNSFSLSLHSMQHDVNSFLLVFT